MRLRLCRGNIMAGNPELCLSRREWSQRFAAFVREATPESLLASSIYFDLRVVWGDEQGLCSCAASCSPTWPTTACSSACWRLTLLRHRPPLGRPARFRGGAGRREGTPDLRREGLTPFVDGARLLAPWPTAEDSSTLRRFAELVRLEVIDAQDGAAYEGGLPLHPAGPPATAPAAGGADLPLSNRLDPTTSTTWTGASCASPSVRPSACRPAWRCATSYEEDARPAAQQPRH